MNSQPNEDFIILNLRSPVVNLSQVARLMNMSPTTFHNRLNAVGRHKPFTMDELVNIEQIIINELNLGI